ncbi:MAG: carbonic anhydrase [Gemmatimonadota bacterium]|jgi:carbonic anhydrase
MRDLHELFENNRAWASERLAADPDFFVRLTEGQSPMYLWIGCSDSRVPAEDIVGVSAGELFVHRNVANVVEPSDINCLSVLQFAVSVLQVRHIIVCGHYGCGGVHAAMGDEPLGIIDAWLARIREVVRLHREELDDLDSHDERFHKLCELNVLQQAVSACYTPSVREAWRAGRDLTVHGLIYGLEDGLLRDLGFSVSRIEDVEQAYERALADL